MDGSIGFSTTESIGNYLESSFTFQKKLFWGGGRNCIIFFVEKIELYE